ncbi:type II secretion system protein [Filibacter tadaridae]|uniref:Prepilin-type N-terminal cleavage/methylation domain-containing protein n=1 Tax=Filibacter tadaridae TaxID=2483811 RepID=A0A3P5XUC1_9BACL|nr:type II secretion system protein [Filibacter tadaridae]VDC32643.1 hypothetical protein FILTAD_02841 [Filibacter tadaridae]
MKKYNQDEKGVTLVEILAALVILSIVLVVFFTFFLQSAKFTQHNKEKLTAVEVAEDVVADVRNWKSKENGKYVNNSYDGYDVNIVIQPGPAGLQKARITVETFSKEGIKESSFTTEMYFGGGS